jgi:hypothetical protein
MHPRNKSLPLPLFVMRSAHLVQQDWQLLAPATEAGNGGVSVQNLSEALFCRDSKPEE